MRIVKIGDEAYAAAGEDPTIALVRAAREQVIAALNTPVELAAASKVTYDHKSDRYSVTFSGQEKSTTLKASNEVAEFVTAHVRNHGAWYGRFENGVLVDVNLVQP